MLSSYDEQIGIADTADDLLTRLTLQGRDLLADTLISLHEGTATLTEQDESLATHAGKIHSADARIEWSAPADVVQRVARAHTPAPGAWTLLNEQRFKIGMMLPLSDGEEVPALRPGQICVWNKRVLVGAGDQNVLEITARIAYSRSGEGLHRFFDPADDRVYLYSQFEPTDARRMFAYPRERDTISVAHCCTCMILSAV